MSGTKCDVRQGGLAGIGLEPEKARHPTPAAHTAPDRTSDHTAHFPYAGRIPQRAGLNRHAHDSRVELYDFRQPLERTAGGGA